MLESPINRDTGYQGTFDNMLRSSVASGILVVDATGQVSAVTAEAERMLNLAPGRRPLTLDDLPESLIAIVREVQDTGRPVINRHLLISIARGGAHPAIVNATRSVLPEQPGVVVALQTDASLVEMEHHLRRLDRLASVGTLSASMAHEIKNALVAVRTFTDVLLEKNPDAELADIVRREVARVDSIVTQMLRFSVPAQPHFSAISLHKVLEHSIRLVQHASRNNQITFTIGLRAEPDALTGDDRQLEQAFVNLLFNAVESIPDEGSLSVVTDLVAGENSSELREQAESPRWLRIRITDTGTGISPDRLGQIFEPFFTTKKSGTGLGLAVTRRIVDEHNGTIRVESTVGKGTTFILLLPAGIMPR